jgi:multidrug efflux pump subunit AcrB
LRDAAEISRGYENPPRFLNHYTWRDANNQWQRTRAITLAVLMRPQQQIADFGHAIDETLASLKQRLPEDLILARTSDQPLQVAENLSLFLRSLYEAIILVVLVALLGFREWRSALLMALSIPLTLAMTFGMMKLVNLDIQQVSVASLIIALGLLVDDPVMQFGNAIKPLLVFSAIPFGLVGALIGLALMKAPFGFMAFLGVASLIGVIVSHVIVLFDFVEERREAGTPLREALLDAGLARLRPVFVTVGTTIFGLVPLALNGGPLWEPLCYAQIGGLILANYVTKLLVPALYAIFVEDLKIIRWERDDHTAALPDGEMVTG